MSNYQGVYFCSPQSRKIFPVRDALKKLEKRYEETEDLDMLLYFKSTIRVLLLLQRMTKADFKSLRNCYSYPSDIPIWINSKAYEVDTKIVKKIIGYNIDEHKNESNEENSQIKDKPIFEARINVKQMGLRILFFIHEDFQCHCCIFNKKSTDIRANWNNQTDSQVRVISKLYDDFVKDPSTYDFCFNQLIFN